MTRIPEFRAYHKETDQMVTINNINFNDNIAIGYVKDNLFEFDLKDIMEYTHLKDINGIKIFENDILIDHTKNYTKVYFEDGAWFTNDGYLDWDTINYFGYEVVGNVLQNEELLIP